MISDLFKTSFFHFSPRFLLGFTLPINFVYDCISTHTSIQVVGLLFYIVKTRYFCDTEKMNVFFPMVTPTVNIRRVGMDVLTDNSISYFVH
jgi:hypothetical protein